MQTVNIHEAKTHLSRLVEMAAKGESFIIAKAGKPLVKVTALSAPEPQQERQLGLWRATSTCLMILTGWAKRRLSSFSAVTNEIFTRYPCVALGGRHAGKTVFINGEVAGFAGKRAFFQCGQSLGSCH